MSTHKQFLNCYGKTNGYGTMLGETVSTKIVIEMNDIKIQHIFNSMIIKKFPPKDGKVTSYLDKARPGV